MEKKHAAEFFAGIGLMRLGLEGAGWEISFANDIDADKEAMYRGHFGSSPEFIREDVHALRASQIPTIQLATASFPCNDLSLAGARRGLAGSQSSTFWGFVDVLRGMGNRKPPLVLLENVLGFLTSNNGDDLREALLALNQLGYVVDAFLIDASRFVPQSRVRLFVVGVLGSEAMVASETPTFHESEGRPAALADFILWNASDIHWKIRNLPPLPKRQKSLTDIIEDVPANSSIWWNEDRSAYLLNQMSERHRHAAEEMINGSKTTYGTVFRRVRSGRSMAELRTDGVAGCLRTPRGGSGRQILFVAGFGKFRVRLVTPRECARLMGADDFNITVPMNQALFGFGDAVCVPVITWIAENYLNPVLKEIHLDDNAATPSSRTPMTYRAAKTPPRPRK